MESLYKEFDSLITKVFGDPDLQEFSDKLVDQYTDSFSKTYYDITTVILVIHLLSQHRKSDVSSDVITYILNTNGDDIDSLLDETYTLTTNLRLKGIENYDGDETKFLINKTFRRSDMFDDFTDIYYYSLFANLIRRVRDQLNAEIQKLFGFSSQTYFDWYNFVEAISGGNDTTVIRTNVFNFILPFKSLNRCTLADYLLDNDYFQEITFKAVFPNYSVRTIVDKDSTDLLHRVLVTLAENSGIIFNVSPDNNAYKTLVSQLIKHSRDGTLTKENFEEHVLMYASKGVFKDNESYECSSVNNPNKDIDRALQIHSANSNTDNTFQKVLEYFIKNPSEFFNNEYFKPEIIDQYCSSTEENVACARCCGFIHPPGIHLFKFDIPHLIQSLDYNSAIPSLRKNLENNYVSDASNVFLRRHFPDLLITSNKNHSNSYGSLGLVIKKRIYSQASSNWSNSDPSESD